MKETYEMLVQCWNKYVLSTTVLHKLISNALTTFLYSMTGVQVANEKRLRTYIVCKLKSSSV